MGNANSAALGTLDEGPPPAEQGLSIRAARLYVFEASTNKWNVARALVEVDFADDAAEGDAPDWHVEVRALKPSRSQLLHAGHGLPPRPEPARVARGDAPCGPPPDAALRLLVACLSAR